ncbi:hypothetical protein [Methanococcus maripaludis]|uniref:Uncharacterized protein n=1 Tax=Methanococcus maripaludis OS7 TaxID=637915 RepID=A0A2Z5PFF0_METMI|nr:hypothetical protein [Methanococcus maripaludis]BAP62572.1 hypothetical protein MMOS7_04860 [Methanococcus maripaludis OS7]
MSDTNWKQKVSPDCQYCENCEDCPCEHDFKTCGAKIVKFTVNFFDLVKEEDWIELMAFDEGIKCLPFSALREKFEDETNCSTYLMDPLTLEQHKEINDKIRNCATNEEILKEVKEFFDKNNIKYEFEIYGYSLPEVKA